MTDFPALFVRDDSAYKSLGFDCYDQQRDAKTYAGNLPVIAHPPCRLWGVLSHLSTAPQEEKELAVWAVGKVREVGGVLEHPAGSRLWRELNLPDPGWLPDQYGGFTLLIDQFDFGHVASKPTKLYIVGCSIGQLPPLPQNRQDEPTKSITGQVPGTARCTQYEREYTPDGLITWLRQVCEIISKAKEL